MPQRIYVMAGAQLASGHASCSRCKPLATGWRTKPVMQSLCNYLDMQTEIAQLTQADQATAMLASGDAKQKRKAVEVLRTLANVGVTGAVRSAAASALLALLPGDTQH